MSLLTEEVGHRIEALCPFFDQFVFDPVGLLQIGHALLKLSDETVETLQVGLWKGGGSSHERHNAPELFAFSETHWNVFSSFKKSGHRGYVVDCSLTDSVNVHIFPLSSGGFGSANNGFIVIVGEDSGIRP